jgi:vitamin B12 transporter
MRLGLAVVMLSLALAAPAAAQMNASATPEAKPLPKVVDPVVVTATKLETPAQQLGASVTVIDGEDFQTYHYPTVDDALRTVPGVEIRRSGTYGKTTSISIRGANPSQVQVLVDGMRVKSPTLGQAELSDLSPDLIERIEVIRGPQSTLYGADAVGGVVNIITKKGTGPFSATAEQQVGNYDTYISRANVLGAKGPFDYALGVFHLESNGHFQNDNARQTAVNLRLGMKLPWDSDVAFTLRWNETNTGLPVKFTGAVPLPIHPVIDTNNENLSDTLVTTLLGHTHPVDWWESSLRVGRYDNLNRFIDKPDLGFDCAFPPCEFPQRLSVERREVEWLNHVHLGKWSTSTFGIEYRRELAHSEEATVFSRATDTWSGFFQQTLRFFDRLFMSAGVRVEDNSVFGTNTTERGSLAYLIKEWGTRIRGGAGSGFRAPTFNDLFFPGFSDLTLKPETSFSYDFGVDQNLWKDRIRLGLTYFQNDVKNLISFIFINTPPFVKGQNLGHVRSAGIEFTSEVDVTDTLTVSLNYTYTDTENLPIDQLLAREPRHRWNGQITWQALPRLQLFTQVFAVTEQFEPTGGASGVYNSGHTRWDVGGTYRILNRYAFLQSLDLIARIQNLLNESYAEVRGFPALGLQGLIGLRASF